MCLPLAAAPLIAGAAGTAGTAATAFSGLQIASLAFSAGSTLLGAYGKIQESKAQAGQARYDAAIQRNNAIISDRNAKDSTRRGEIAEQQQRIKVGQLKGRQRSVLGTSGVEVDSGSALDVQLDTAEIGEFEALTIRHNAEQEAAGQRQQASNFRAGSQNSLIAADNITSGGLTAAGSTLLSGAGSVASKWYNFREGF